MIRYASERWGSDHVAQLVTFSTIKARAAVRDAAEAAIAGAAPRRPAASVTVLRYQEDSRFHKRA